jgi:site-specific DNA recombinase
LAEVIDLASFQRHQRALRQRGQDLLAREPEVTAETDRLVEISSLVTSMAAVLERLRGGLEQATFKQRRQHIELLIDRVVVTDGAVEIRYVIPTTEGGAPCAVLSLAA